VKKLLEITPFNEKEAPTPPKGGSERVIPFRGSRGLFYDFANRILLA
jgi:hypothetical protein